MRVATVRHVFAAVIVISLIALATTGTVAGSEHEEECQLIGTIEGTAGPELAEQPGWEASDSYDSEVYHCPEGELSGDADFVRGSAATTPNGNGTGEIYLSERFYTESAYAIYHERGHNLGFGHDDGMMSYDRPDVDPSTPLASETRTIARHTEGLHHVDWSDDDSTAMLTYVAREYAHGNTTSSELGYAARRWSEQDGEDVYADDTIVAELEGDLPAYADDEFDRSVTSNGFYRNETTDSGGPWW